MQRFGYFLTLVMLSATISRAQVVRFQTSVGDFDLVLNPTSNPALQGHVDNILQYVLSGRYDDTVINRAARDQAGFPFVLQMGSFETLSPAVPGTINGFQPIPKFDSIQGAPAQQYGLSNSIGTVGLALRGDGFGGTDQNSGQSSFYINLIDNAYLDHDFAVFAQVANLTTVNTIMALPSIDLTLDPAFGADTNNFAFTEVPMLPNGNLVFIRKAFVVQNITNPKGDYNGNGKVDAADYVAWRNTQSTGIMGGGLAGDGDENGLIDDRDYNIWRVHFGAVAVSGAGVAAIPEPQTIWLVAVGLVSSIIRRRRTTFHNRV